MMLQKKALLRKLTERSERAKSHDAPHLIWQMMRNCDCVWPTSRNPNHKELLHSQVVRQLLQILCVRLEGPAPQPISEIDPSGYRGNWDGLVAGIDHPHSA
jgi:hypothetical protein